jgi:DNA-binding MarR family transcriptional regulator
VSTTGYAVACRFRELLAPAGLEPREFALLRAIAANEGQSQQTIGDRLQIPPRLTVAFVDALEARGLVERRQKPTDRRARALFLTPAGRDTHRKHSRAAVEHERDLRADLHRR